MGPDRWEALVAKAEQVRDQLSRAFGLSGPELAIGMTQDQLFEAAVENDLGRVDPDGPRDSHKAFATALGTEGPLVYYTDPACTGRPVDDTFCVDRPSVTDEVWWKDGFSKFDPAAFDELLPRVVAHLNAERPTLYVTDLFCGWDKEFAEPFRFVGEYASHAYFCNVMFPSAVRDDSDREARGWTLINVPSFMCEPERDSTRSERAVIIDIEGRVALVLGPADYCGVNKKTMFTIMNFVLPGEGNLSMHCSANVGDDGRSAILFGLSGTGKTTLSADPDRRLIGDDEHVWTNRGVSNFENGCYAKLIDLDKDDEPVIAAALSMKGTLVENVPRPAGRDLSEMMPDEFDLTDSSITENTRFAYPLTCNPNVAEGASGPHPDTIVLLTADAFGVLPPVSILNHEEAMYHFVMGFTSKLAGTEVGVVEPEPSFSPCFGAPFMSRHPNVYAELLAKRMNDHNTRCVLLNTGWTGGAYGTGKRMSLKYTRAILAAALAGEFDQVEVVEHPILGLKMPTSCPGVPSEILSPRLTWDDQDAYDAAALELREMFRKRFNSQGYESRGIRSAI